MGSKLGISRDRPTLVRLKEELAAGRKVRNSKIPRSSCWGLGLGSKQESKSIEHTFIQVEVQKHVPSPNAYM